ASGIGIFVPLNWTTDGTLLFISSDDPTAHPSSQLYAVDPGTQLTRVLSEDDGGHDQPVWSANGHHLAYVHSNGRSPQVVVMDAIAQNAVVAGMGTEPALSPTGSRLALVHRRRILIGSVGERHRHLFARGAWPAWSSNGSLLAYLRRGAVWIARPNGK